MDIENVMWSIVLATWCMILDNGATENQQNLLLKNKVSNLKKVAVDYYFSDLVHDPGQKGHGKCIFSCFCNC